MSSVRGQALTPALVQRHIQNRSGGWDTGMLDIAQDHILCHLHESGTFERGLVFKGGTALQKCRSGTRGRFSTDLDFCVSNRELVEEVFDSVDEYACHGFRFVLDNRDPVAGRADLLVYPPFTNDTRRSSGFLRISSKLEISRHVPWLEPEHSQMLRSPVHIALDHTPPIIPIMNLVEAIAEKLARYAREPIARDLYDLCWYGHNLQFNEALVRSLWVKKVYLDFVMDNRWKGTPFDPLDILSEGKLKHFRPEQTGLLDNPYQVKLWDDEFRSRYGFLTELSKDDQHWARCHRGDLYEFEQYLESL
jgi:predicted nucleotidyltransferase component of viral defense system